MADAEAMIVFFLWHTAERRQMKKKLEELNLLDDFLFGTLISHPIYGERFAKTLVATLLGRDVKILKIVPQMNFYGHYHYAASLRSIWL